MASLNAQQAGRDAADYTADRHDPRFAQYREASDATPLDAEKQAVVDKAVAQIDAAFGPNSVSRRQAREAYAKAEAVRLATVVKASLYLSVAA